MYGVPVPQNVEEALLPYAIVLAVLWSVMIMASIFMVSWLVLRAGRYGMPVVVVLVLGVVAVVSIVALAFSGSDSLAQIASAAVGGLAGAATIAWTSTKPPPPPLESEEPPDGAEWQGPGA
jgi:hypothetical protein